MKNYLNQIMFNLRLNTIKHKLLFFLNKFTNVNENQ